MGKVTDATAIIHPYLGNEIANTTLTEYLAYEHEYQAWAYQSLSTGEHIEVKPWHAAAVFDPDRNETTGFGFRKCWASSGKHGSPVDC